MCRLVFVATWLGLTGVNLERTAVAQNSAPSSHMVFEDHFDGDIIINQVRVPKSGDALYTYYEALGWRGRAAGYAGIQSHPKAKNFIFSIWDHKEHKAPIKAEYHGPGTKTVGFGGEGTGLKSWNFELGWKTDVWYTLVARCWPVGKNTHFGFWSRAGDTKKWTHLVTMDVATNNARFRGGTDAFIEDWLSTGKNVRESNLRGGWKRKMDGTWFPFQSARYSVNSWDLEKGKRSFNFKTQWDGGTGKDAEGGFFFMKAGGKDTQPTAKNPSQHALKVEIKQPSFAPIRIESFTAKRSGGNIELSWSIDTKSSPQFGYSIFVSEKDGAKIKPLKVVKGTKPQEKSQTLVLESTRAYQIQLICTDIFGQNSKPKLVVVMP